MFLKAVCRGHHKPTAEGNNQTLMIMLLLCIQYLHVFIFFQKKTFKVSTVKQFLLFLTEIWEEHLRSKLLARKDTGREQGIQTL